MLTCRTTAFERSSCALGDTSAAGGLQSGKMAWQSSTGLSDVEVAFVKANEVAAGIVAYFGHKAANPDLEPGRVRSRVRVGVRVRVSVRVRLRVRVGVRVGVGFGVRVWVRIRVAVRVKVTVKVRFRFIVRVRVRVKIMFRVRVGFRVIPIVNIKGWMTRCAGRLGYDRLHGARTISSPGAAMSGLKVSATVGP